MSTATIEAPITQQATPTQEETVRSLIKPQITKPDATKTVTVIPEAKKVEVKTEAKVDPRVTDQEKNWAELRTAREAADKRATELEARLKERETEFEAFKKNPVPKEFEERLTKAEKERAEYQRELRASALARDPDFKRKYSEPIHGSITRMSDAFVRSGADPKEVQQAISTWNTDKFGEWLESMPVGARMEATAAFSRAVELDQQRNQELQDSDRAWEDHQKRLGEQQQQFQQTHMESLKADRKAALDEMDKDEFFKSDKELRAQAEALLDRAAGLGGEKLGNKEILTALARSQLLERQHKTASEKLTTLQSELEATRKTLEERDAFIKKQYGSIPTPGPTTGKESVPDGNNPDFIRSLIRPTIRA